ncbi:MAG: gliding motility-associated C-terminal domain-containing protein [Saprospiraceae bacterium]|nr:gliding motility-associated C-terminal domain-containing protein [Saprospiraceae bacterium]
MMRLGILSIFLALCSVVHGQYIPNGAAIDLGDGCYQFQADERFHSGAVWEDRQLSFADTIDITIEFIPDCSGGMDGMAIIFQPNGVSEGSSNPRLGYEGISPSLAVELDLFMDPEDNDPNYSHLSIMVDGIVDHNESNQMGTPVRLLPGWDQLPDCIGRTVRVFWDPVTHRLKVYFECQLRIDQEIPADFPLLQTKVFWGYGVGLTSFTPFFRVCKDLRKFLDSIPDQLICPGEEIDLTAPITGKSYSWQPGYLVDDSTAYQVKLRADTGALLIAQVQDTCGFIYEEKIRISIKSIADQIDIGPPDTLLCSGDSILLAAEQLDGAVYKWLDGTTGAQRWIHQEGQYFLSVNQGLCLGLDSIDVELQLSAGIDLGRDTVLCRGTTWQLDTNLPNGYEVVWNDGVTGRIRMVTEAGSYSMVASSPCGNWEDAIDVAFIDCTPVYVPNAFSPNSDGNNDVFRPDGSVPSIVIHRFIVADRWGSLVHEEVEKPLGSIVGWDGQIRGEPANGVFIYILELTSLDGSMVSLQGSITLLR